MGADRDHACGTVVPFDVRVVPALERLAAAAERIAMAAERIADGPGVSADTPRVTRAPSNEGKERELIALLGQYRRGLDIESVLQRDALVDDHLNRAMDPESLPVEPVVPALPSWAVPAVRRPAPRRGGPFDRAPSEIPVSVRRAPVVVAAPAGSAWPPPGAASSDEGER